MSNTYNEKYSRLKPGYKNIYKVLCFLALVSGVLLFAYYGQILTSSLGISANECVRCQEGGGMWIILLLSGLPVIVFLALASTLGVYAFRLFRMRKIEKAEILPLLLFQSFPSSWLIK